MNFFQTQAKAKRHTFLLVILFSVAILSLIFVANFALIVGLAYMDTQDVALAFADYTNYMNPATIGISSLLVLGIVAFGSISMFLKLRSGGSVIAQELGGQKLSPNTQNFYHRQLLNVVEEMAIASGVSVPSVYILPDEQSINAFAAGHSMDDVVIGVTQGLIETLNREELQGVIAHEFSHIFNGDMKLNMRLTGTLHGILMMGIVGRLLLRSLRYVRSGSSNSKNKNGGSGIAVVIIIGLIFLIVGYVGSFIGGIIKATISRNREYLADASAVQYTRYPQGIAGALKKIGGIAKGSTIGSGAASTYSHLYFSKGVTSYFSNLLSTHPPLEKRILAIEPQWNGIYPLRVSRISQTEPTPEDKKRKKEKILTGIAIGGMKLQEMTQVSAEHKAYAKYFLTTLDENVKRELKDPLGAQSMVLALLSDTDEKLRQAQWAQVEGVLALELERVYLISKSVKREAMIKIMQLTIPTLKESTLAQYLIFKSYLSHFIEIDKKMTLFEWSLFQIITRPLDRHFGLHKSKPLIHYSLGGVKEDVEILLSTLVQMQYPDDEEVKEVFKKIALQIKAGALTYKAKASINFELFKKAIQNIEEAKLPIKERIMEAVVLSLRVDSKLTSLEIEMLHALAAILELPLPPLEV